MVETTQAVLDWQGGMRFCARSGSGREVTVDSPSRPQHAGPSPMEMLLIGVAGCTAMDVVAILEKMRIPLMAASVEAVAHRAPVNPKRFTAIELRYRLRGKGLTPDKAERAVALSLSTYCSAVASLHPDCRVTTVIDIQQE